MTQLLLSMTQPHILFPSPHARVGCYVHYPTVSSDMISRVASKKAMYNNNSNISSKSGLFDSFDVQQHINNNSNKSSKLGLFDSFDGLHISGYIHHSYYFWNLSFF
jgi:hypothetical protein